MDYNYKLLILLNKVLVLYIMDTCFFSLLEVSSMYVECWFLESIGDSLRDVSL